MALIILMCVTVHDFDKDTIAAHSNVQQRHETLPRILSARKDLVKGHLSKSFVESVDKEPKDSKRRSSLVGF